MSPEFLVVIPTVRRSRAGFNEVMSRIQEGFTRPTAFDILDGSDGKAVALNRALRDVLPASLASVYVTLDDDIVPPAGWQDGVVAGFQDVSRVGAWGLWVGDDRELQRIIGAERLDPPQTDGATRWRRVQRGHHIAGGCISYRREVALAIGPQPETGEKYQIWEDAWRGRRAMSLGWELGFLEGFHPEYVEYEDPPEYLAWRSEQVARSRRDADRWLRDSGIPDPWTLRLRRWIARLRGRG